MVLLESISLHAWVRWAKVIRSFHFSYSRTEEVKQDGSGGAVARSLPYTWEQTLRDVTILVPLPEGANKRSITVAFKPDRLVVQFKGQDKPVIDGELRKVSERVCVSKVESVCVTVCAAHQSGRLNLVLGRWQTAH